MEQYVDGGIHSADPDQDALLDWLIHDSGKKTLLASAWHRLLSEPEGVPILTPAEEGFKEQMHRLEAEMIYWALRRSGGNKTRAARSMGIKRTTFNAKLKGAAKRGLIG